MRVGAVLVAACAVAALVPFFGRSTTANTTVDGFPGWPPHFEAQPLEPLPLTDGELRFEREFSGRIARFSSGHREIALRWVTEATRSLHPAEECLKSAGYDVRPQPLHRDAEGHLWSALTASRGGVTLRVRERIHDNAGQSWTDVSAWYWDALLGHSTGPWWAVTIAERE